MLANQEFWTPRRKIERFRIYLVNWYIEVWPTRWNIGGTSRGAWKWNFPHFLEILTDTDRHGQIHWSRDGLRSFIHSHMVTKSRFRGRNLWKVKKSLFYKSPPQMTWRTKQGGDVPSPPPRSTFSVRPWTWCYLGKEGRVGWGKLKGQTNENLNFDGWNYTLRGYSLRL